METACLRESDRQVELEDSIIAWQDKYDRLYESHKRVQKVNQNLEDKLLKLVDRNAGERAQLTSDVATLSVRLAQANYNIATLQREIVSNKLKKYQANRSKQVHSPYEQKKTFPLICSSHPNSNNLISDEYILNQITIHYVKNKCASKRAPIDGRKKGLSRVLKKKK